MAKLFLIVALVASVESFALNAPVQRLPIARRAAALTMQQQTKEPETKKGFFGKIFPTKEEKPAGDEEELTESKKLMQKVKDAGTAGIISYIFWEWAFWGGEPTAAACPQASYLHARRAQPAHPCVSTACAVSVPFALYGFQAAFGYWPDFKNGEDMQKLGAEAFAFVNVARFAVPLRIGLALGTTPWVQANIVDNFGKKDEA